VISALVVLGLLVFSKYFYMASFTSYFTFYLIEKFDLSVASSQLHLFLFLGAVAAGTFFGGPIGDKIGRKAVIWFSILGVAPFTLVLPHVDLFWTSLLSVVIGFILASAFSAIVVYAQELVPGNVGMIAGVFFGLMFGFGGIGAALLGHLADIRGIEYVYWLCSFLPLLGVLAIFLPRTKRLIQPDPPGKQVGTSRETGLHCRCGASGIVHFKGRCVALDRPHSPGWRRSTHVYSLDGSSP
jgi:FSR family fosmidomycin resistance protein-like MFS transporter